MGAVGAVGGVGGGLGSVGDGGSSGGDVGPIMAPDPTSSLTQSWFNASAVMGTSGEVDGSTVTLDDGDFKGGVGELKEEDIYPTPGVGATALSNPDRPAGVGSSPSAEVVDKVASIYAASRM